MADARKLKDEAAAQAGKGKHRRAAELYEQIAHVEPDDGQWPHRAGEAWKRAGDRQAAVDALATAADVYARTGFFLKAISVAKMILELDPGRTGTQAMLAALYARRDAPVPEAQAALRSTQPVAPIRVPPSRSGPIPLVPLEPRAPREIDLPPDPVPPLPPPASARRTSPPPPASGPVVDSRPGPPPIKLPPPRSSSSPPPAPPARRPVSPPSLPTLDAIPLPDFSESLAEPDRAFESIEPDDAIPLEIIPVDFPSPPPPRVPTPPPPLPPSARSGPPSIGLERDTPLNLRVPGAKVSQNFPVAGSAFEIPIDETHMGIAPNDLPRIPLFSSLDEQRLHRLIQGAKVLRCRPGQVVVRQGEQGESLFVVVHGSMVVRVAGAAEPVARLGEGQFFGELALLSSEPRSATVAAEGEAELIEIRREVVWELIDEAPEVLPVLLSFFRDRLIDRLIATSPLFAPFDGEESHQLAARFQFLELTSGSELVHEGERAQGLYIVLLGRCEVHMARAGGMVATLGPGDLVGEISLLTHGKATATVTAVTPVWALAMPRHVFQEVILTHPQVLIYVNDVAEQRRSADNSRIDMI